jgi:hypothetical protein
MAFLMPVSHPIALRINDANDRMDVAKALIKAGYTVRIEGYKREGNYAVRIEDIFVVIVECPEFPAYEKRVE